MAFGDINMHCPWKAWHSWHCHRGCLRGRRRTWVPIGAVVAATISMVNIAFGDSNFHFLWEDMGRMVVGCLWRRAWVPFGAVVVTAVCLAGVTLGDVQYHLVWSMRHLTISIFFATGILFDIRYIIYKMKLFLHIRILYPFLSHLFLSYIFFSYMHTNIYVTRCVSV